MKNKFILYSFLLVFLFIGCKKPSPTPDLLQIQLENLKNKNMSWGLVGGSVIKDNYDVTSQFSGFTLTIGEYTYITQNSIASAWPTSGTWQFVNDNPNLVVREDGVEIDVAIANNQLTLSFTVSGIGGRVSGIDGNYVFTLTSN